MKYAKEYSASDVSYDISVDSDTFFGGTITDRVYYFDFAKIPKAQKYAVVWTFQTASIATLLTLLATGPICVHMDSFSGPYQFQARDTDCPTHSVFGALNPNFYSGTAGMMTTDTETNGTIILNSLPSTNFFTIKLRYGYGTAAPASFSRYVCTLQITPLFEE